MSSDAASCLQRTWPLIVQLVIEIGCLVSLMRPLAKPEHQRVLRLVRLAEGLMRRWLVLSACARPLKDPGPMGERSGYTGVPAGLSQGLGLPLFRLADPEPQSRAAPVADAPAEPFRLLALQQDPLVPVQLAPMPVPILAPVPVPVTPHDLVPVSPEAPAPSPAMVRLWERSQALLGVMRAPDKHIARMRRFLARGLCGLGPFPLRLKRPWGQSALERRARPEAYDALRDLRHFVRDALVEQVAPG